MVQWILTNRKPPLEKGGDMVGINTGSGHLKWITGGNIDYILPGKARGIISYVWECGSNHGEIVGQKRSAEISILAQILLSKIRFVLFSYIRISCWFCETVRETARVGVVLIRS